MRQTILDNACDATTFCAEGNTKFLASQLDSRGRSWTRGDLSVNRQKKTDLRPAFPPYRHCSKYRKYTFTSTGQALAEIEAHTERQMVPRAKKPKHDGNSGAIVAMSNGDADAKKQQHKYRTSSLQAPTMLLTGHLSAVNTVKFHPNGQSLRPSNLLRPYARLKSLTHTPFPHVVLTGSTLASGSHDKKIFLWNTYGDCSNYAVLTGHRNAVLSVSYTDDGEGLVSCSADMTIRTWDTMTGEQLSSLREHTAVVNCVAATPSGHVLVASASDDGSVKLWDTRTRKASNTLTDAGSRFALCAVDISENGEYVYAGGIDNVVKGWDLRKDNELCLRMKGHEDTITGLSVSPDGTHVLTNSMDQTMRSFDVRAFVEQEDRRCVRIFSGHQHSQEKNLLRCSWSADGKRVSGGSSDHMVHVWDVASGELTYSLPGHSGSVNEVSWSGSEGSIICSASSDRSIYLGELM